MVFAGLTLSFGALGGAVVFWQNGEYGIGSLLFFGSLLVFLAMTLYYRILSGAAAVHEGSVAVDYVRPRRGKVRRKKKRWLWDCLFYAPDCDDLDCCGCRD